MTRPPLDLEAIRQRVEAATKPTGDTRWHVETNATYSSHVYSGPDEHWRDSVDIATYMHSEADAVFIAHAREDVPDLLAEVERLRSGIETVLGLTSSPGPRAESILRDLLGGER